MFTHEDWQKAVTAELAWTTPDGVVVEPLYSAGPGWPALSTRGWMIRQDLDLPDPDSFRAAALEAVAGGVEVLGVRLDRPTRLGEGRSGEDGLAVVGREDLLRAVGGLDVPLAVVGGVAGPVAASVLERVLFVELDLPEALVAGHEWDVLEGSVLSWQSLFEAGATPVRELTWATAFTIEWLRRGLGIPAWSFAVSGQLLLELAKLRAARILLANVCQAFGMAPGGLHVRTGRRDLTRADAPNNLLRQGLGALAGALSGAETVHVDPYTISACSDGLRLARNQQHLLRHEGGLGGDSVAGAYAVEGIAQQMASLAWERVQELEKTGGPWKAGRRQQLLAELEADRQAHRGTLVGVTRYAAEGPRLEAPLERELTSVDSPRQFARGSEARELLEEGAELLALCPNPDDVPLDGKPLPVVRFEEALS